MKAKAGELSGHPLSLCFLTLFTSVLKIYLLFIDTLFYSVSRVGSNVMGANGNIEATSFK